MAYFLGFIVFAVCMIAVFAGKAVRDDARRLRGFNPRSGAGRACEAPTWDERKRDAA